MGDRVGVSRWLMGDRVGVVVLTGAYTGFVEPEVSVTARAGEAPTSLLGKPLVEWVEWVLWRWLTGGRRLQ